MIKSYKYMKKFKKSIEISYENIKDVLQVPIVEGIRKINESAYIEGRGEPYFTWTVLVLDVNGFGLPFDIDRGCVLALDICGTWHAFTKDEWDRYKNDEI